MIHRFKGRIVLCPTEWCNSVVDWISGVHSPNNTITVKNTLNPKDTSLSLEVNIEAVAKALYQQLKGKKS